MNFIKRVEWYLYKKIKFLRLKIIILQLFHQTAMENSFIMI